MECLQNRIDSFSKVKRVRNPQKSTATVSLKWPHPSSPKFIATPEALAEAGFYFTPGFEERDDVTCFMCQKQLAYWEADDDPFNIHWEKCGDKCPWATVRCGLQGDLNDEGDFVSSDVSRVPTSKIMEKARRATFCAGEGWIHDREKNHGANSHKMALAGFVFTPQTPGDDLATCLYCHLSLSGWDADDEPMQEHRKRSNKFGHPCPFFSFVDPHPPSRSQEKAPSKSKQPPKHTRSASTSKHRDLVVPMKTHDGDGSADDSDMPPASSRRSTVSNSRQSKTTRTPKAHTRSRSRSRKGTSEDSEDIEEDDIEDEASLPTKKSKGRKSTTAKQRTKSRSKSVIPSVADDNQEETPTARQKSSRCKGPSAEDNANGAKVPTKSGKRKDPKRIADSEEDSGKVENVLRKSTRKASAQVIKSSTGSVAQKAIRTRKATETIDSESQLESDIQVTEDEKGIRRKARQPSGSKARILATRKASRSKPKAEPAPEESSMDENNGRSADEEPTVRNGTSSVDMPKPGATKGQSGSVRAKGKTKVVRQQMNSELDEPGDTLSDHEADETVVHVLRRGSNKRFSNGISKSQSKDETSSLHVRKAMTKMGYVPSQTDGDVNMEERADAETRAEVSDSKGERQPTYKQTKTAADAERTIRLTKKNPEGIEMQIIGLDSSDTSAAGSIRKIASQEMPAPTTPPNAKVQAGTTSFRSPSPPSHRAKLPTGVGVHNEEPIITMQHDDAVLMTPQKASNPQVPHIDPVPPANDSGSSAPMPSTLPFLSKLPFAPTQSLTDAELDMTVEEWIRYQMEVEYDKFRRDGERELGRFKKRAEEVRTVIENL